MVMFPPAAKPPCMSLPEDVKLSNTNTLYGEAANSVVLAKALLAQANTAMDTTTRVMDTFLKDI
jgi:hypothetical protein